MSELLNKQETHNLGMLHIGEVLEKQGIEFLGVNSDLKKNPQFVFENNFGKLIFVWVSTKLYPEDHQAKDEKLLKRLVKHAKEKEAQLWFAGVGLANAQDLEAALTKNDDYLVKFDDFEILDLNQ